MRNALNTQLGTGAPRELQCAFFTLDRERTNPLTWSSTP